MRVGARRQGWQQVVGAVCWALCVQVLAVELVAASAWGHPYDFRTDYLSDLGNTTCGMVPNSDHTFRYVCSPLHQVMNASFITFGLLMLAGLLLTRDLWPRRRLTGAGQALAGLAALGPIIIGFNPENINYWVHAITGAVEFPFQSVAMVLLGLSAWSTNRRLGVFTFCCGAVGCVGTALYFADGYGPLGPGVIERIALDPFAIWPIVTGLSLLARHPAPGYLWTALVARLTPPRQLPATGEEEASHEP